MRSLNVKEDEFTLIGGKSSLGFSDDDTDADHIVPGTVNPTTG